jgi:hypothetical protein
MNINPNTKRHGKAAALAMHYALECINNGAYGEPKAVRNTQALLDRYFDGYARSSTNAKTGFREMVGEIWACNIDCGSISTDALSLAKEMRGPALSEQEREAHAKAWLGTSAAVPKTARDGRARFIALMRGLEVANWKRDAPATNQRLVSDA